MYYVKCNVVRGKHITTNEFIEIAKKVHGDKYNYSVTDLKHRDNKRRILIVCPIHGVFSQRVDSHLNGQGCKFCANIDKIKDTENFIIESNDKHNNKYSYEKTDLLCRDELCKVIITCPIHGDFKMAPNNHLNGKGCPLCGIEKQKISKTLTNDEFIYKAKLKHNNKYHYEKTDLLCRDEFGKVIITCPIHGDFKITPNNHLFGQGCRFCGIDGRAKKLSMTTQDFIKKSNEIYNNKYSYTKTDLMNRDEDGKVIITCSIHGDFKMSPSNHLSKHECPFCNVSKAEKEIKDLLIENGIVFEEQKRFEWLGKQSLDFYLPQHNVAIECQGLQHFKSIEYFGGDKSFKHREELDNEKLKLCKENNVRLLYYANYKLDFPYKVHTDKKILLEAIKL